MGIDNGLAAERERLGWTQAEAGEAAGITRQSYAAVESGRSVPSTEVALRLARAMGRSVEELFRLPDAPQEQVSAVWAGASGASGSRRNVERGSDIAVGESAAFDDPTGRRVRLVRVEGRWVAYPTGEGERPIRAADGVVVGVEQAGTDGAGVDPAGTDAAGMDPVGEDRRSDRSSVEPGRTVRVALLEERPPPPELAAVGCDPAFGIVAEALRRERSIEAVWSPRGSRAALEALAEGRAHVAGAHLQDPDTGESNEPWIRALVPFPCTRVRFATWEEGLLVRRGNPEGIGDVTDLVRPEVRLVNREPGSGSRLLLDEALAAAGIPADRIRGYGTAARGHLAVGEAIAAGLADAGVGIRAAGAAFGLDVLPLRTEPYELIIPNHFLDLPAVQALLDTLGRPGIRSQVEALQGYDGRGMGEAV